MMEIRILGAHNFESENSRLVSLLVDGVLAIDSGALTSGLSFEEQRRVRAVILSHHHYDHLRDVPALAINFQSFGSSVEVYGAQSVYEALSGYLMNGVLYPDFMKTPPEKPAVKFNLLEPLRPLRVGDYEVLAVPVHHAVPTVGFQVTSPDGRRFFYTSDTGPGLDECWRQVSPELLIIETTLSNEHEEFALKSGHLTPALLEKELEGFRKLKGYLPEVLLIHMSPLEEDKIGEEVTAVAGRLDASIRLAREGMRLKL